MLSNGHEYTDWEQPSLGSRIGCHLIAHAELACKLFRTSTFAMFQRDLQCPRCWHYRLRQLSMRDLQERFQFANLRPRLHQGDTHSASMSCSLERPSGCGS